MRNSNIIILFLLLALNSFAMNNKGGVITWQHLGGYTYKIRITTLTEIGSPPGNADRCKMTLFVNHTDSMVLLRVNGPNNNPSGDCTGTLEGVEINSNSKLNIYEGVYIFPCEGKFILSTYDNNRHAGILNIPNSANYSLYFESEIVVPLNNYSCSRNSVNVELFNIIPVNQPLQKFYPVTINPNGDSLVYTLIPCQYNNGQSIPGYVASGFSVNPVTGEITCINTLVGEYNFCCKVSMYRNQEYIGSINNDFLIKVISNSAITYTAFTSNFTPMNGVYQLSASQTLTLSGSNSASINCVYDLVSELTGSTTPLSVNSPSFSISVSYSASMARNEPYKLYIKGRSLVTPGGTNDTLIRIKFLGAPSNTCGIMGITTTTCFVSIKENHQDHFDFKLYPSVTSNILHLEGPYKNTQIMDVSGKLIKPLSLENNAINVENLSTGVYILIVKDLNNKDHYYKFVKN